MALDADYRTSYELVAQSRGIRRADSYIEMAMFCKSNYDVIPPFIPVIYPIDAMRLFPLRLRDEGLMSAVRVLTYGPRNDSDDDEDF